jgi:hypothetical protein
MSQALEILNALKGIGVIVRVIPPDSLELEPASVIPPDLLSRVRERKPEILEVLARPSMAVQPAKCAHCDGTGECDCPACNLRRVSGPVPCCMCRWEDHRFWLAATRPRECWFCEERRLHGEPGLCPDCEAKMVRQ